MKALLTIFVFIFFCHSGKTQQSLSLKLRQADTVLLISHRMTSHSWDDLVSSNGENIKIPDLVLDDRLNQEVIVESKVLSSVAVGALIKMLTYNYNPDITMEHSCFDPHHSIIIIKDNTMSYIDLCFRCMDFETSKDITQLKMKKDKWDKLLKFFRSQGFKYKLPLEKE